METGFFHPERGYWQTTGNVPENIIEGYPEGTVQVPLRPGPYDTWNDGENQWIAGERPPAFIDANDAYLALVSWVNSFFAGFAPAVPDTERAAFAAKEAAARAYVAGVASDAQTALLSAEAAITGETLDDLAALVIAEADTDAQISARVSGLRRAVKTQLDAATGPAQLDAILDAAKVQAQAMAADLGLTEPAP